MALQNLQKQDMSLVLSSDAKPRLKWTPELHQRFVDAVSQLGGAYKATPKSLMRVMGIHGLTLYHLKSHLQKYRLGKSEQSQTYNENKQEDYREDQGSRFIEDFSDGTQNQINESLQIAEALQIQMEVQRKLHEQIEVQRHLQLRIEAQGKYLQSVLKKAQDTLAGYNSSSVGMELAKAELSQLVSSLNTDKKHLGNSGCSLESSLTSSENSGIKDEIRINHKTNDTINGIGNSVVLPLMKTFPEEKGESSCRDSGGKRSGSTISGGNFVEQPYAKRSAAHIEKIGGQLRKFGLLGTLDLNCKFLNEFDTGPRTIDLNCKGVEQFSGHL